MMDQRQQADKRLRERIRLRTRRNVRIYGAHTVQFGPVGEQALGPTPTRKALRLAESLRDELTGSTPESRLRFLADSLPDWGDGLL